MKDFADELLTLLTGKFAGLNLTRISEPQEFYEKQVLDSIAAYEQSKTFSDCIQKHKLHIDIGFGGGFPLLPLAKRLEGVKFLGFEARAKKAKAVNEIAESLALTNVECFHQRFEDINYDHPISMSFKAVGPMKKMLKAFRSFTHIDVFFYKGPQVYDLEGVEKEYEGWRLICEDLIDVPGTEARYLIGYTKKSVPRGTKSNKELVNLSALV